MILITLHIRFTNTSLTKICSVKTSSPSLNELKGAVLCHVSEDGFSGNDIQVACL